MCQVYDKCKEELITVGDVFKSNEGCVAVVIRYKGYKKVTLRFLDDFEAEITLQAGRLKTGGFKNPYYPSVCGVGYLGVGIHTANGCRYSRHVYNKWKAMITRLYSEKSFMVRPTYKGCTVDKTWFNFQIFADWYKNQRFSTCGYQLDKDVLVKGNRHYSPETCCLVPQEINTLMGRSLSCKGDFPIGVHRNKHSGRFVAQACGVEGRYLGTYDTPELAFYAYKKEKESYVKEVAERWKDQIDPRAYNALMSWEVDIDD